MKFSVFPVVALIGSASLAFGRPQYSQPQIEYFPNLLFDPSTDPNPIISPLPAQFNPTIGLSSARLIPSSLLSLNDAPNLAMAVPETSLPETPVDSTMDSTDYFQLINPSRDDSFDIARKLQSITVTNGAMMLIDSILNGEYTYGILGLSPDLKKVVSVAGGKNQDWIAFGQAVRTAPMGFALHLIDEGMLLLVNLRILKPADLDRSAIAQETPIPILRDNESFLLSLVQRKVEKKYGVIASKVTYTIEVHNDRDLENAINTYSHAPIIHFDERQTI